MFLNKKHYGLTLVELIIVIVILAILATIALMSFNGYGVQSRDTARITNLSSISKGLGVYQTNAGKFPPPNNSFKVINGGLPIGSQGEVGTGIIGALKIGGDLKDPIDNKPIEYATNSKGCKFEMLSFLENQDSNPSFASSEVGTEKFMRRKNKKSPYVESFPYVQGVTTSFNAGDTDLGIIVNKNNETNSYYFEKGESISEFNLASPLESLEYTQLAIVNNTKPPIASNKFASTLNKNYSNCPTLAKGCVYKPLSLPTVNNYNIDIASSCYQWFDEAWFNANNGVVLHEEDFDYDFDGGDTSRESLPFDLKTSEGLMEEFSLNANGLIEMRDHGQDFRIGFEMFDEDLEGRADDGNGGCFGTLCGDDEVGVVRYGYTADYVVVSYESFHIRDADPNERLYFQAVIYKDGTIKYQYKDMPGMIADGGDNPVGVDTDKNEGNWFDDGYGIWLPYDDATNLYPITAESSITFTPIFEPIGPIANNDSFTGPVYDEGNFIRDVILNDVAKGSPIDPNSIVISNVSPGITIGTYWFSDVNRDGIWREYFGKFGPDKRTSYFDYDNWYPNDNWGNDRAQWSLNNWIPMPTTSDTSISINSKTNTTGTPTGIRNKDFRPTKMRVMYSTNRSDSTLGAGTVSIYAYDPDQYEEGNLSNGPEYLSNYISGTDINLNWSNNSGAGFPFGSSSFINSLSISGFEATDSVKINDIQFYIGDKLPLPQTFTFDYTIKDMDGNVSNTATVTLTITN